MKKHILTIITAMTLLLISASSSEAQRRSSDVIKLIQDQYNAIENFKAEFLQVQEWTILEMSDTLRGSISLIKPDYFIIETSETRLMTDGKSVWDYKLLEKSAIIDKFDPEGESFLPKEFLFEFPKRYYAVDFRQEERNGKDGFVIEMDPKNPDEEIMQHLEVWVESGIWVVKQVKYTTIDDDILHYYLNNYEINTDINVGIFENLKPGSEVRIRDFRKKGGDK
ncbi:outer membrane lipoprotein carrier protein LolA [candidate division KSB1 bacterium]